MAVTLTSDLVADVMRAADPQRLKSISAKLAEPPDSTFSHVLVAASEVPVVNATAITGRTIEVNEQTSLFQDEHAVSVHRSFEQMVLRNLLESILPAAESGVYGGDMSAGIWRSLEADQLASTYADNGGLGIAKVLTGKSADASQSQDLNWVGQWPYFASGQIRSFTG